jgi:hypothetical protein
MADVETQPGNDVVQGRACIRLIEAADALLGSELTPEERAALVQARQQCVRRLRGLVARLPPGLTAQILAASDKVVGPSQGASQN